MVTTSRKALWIRPKLSVNTVSLFTRVVSYQATRSASSISKVLTLRLAAVLMQITLLKLAGYESSDHLASPTVSSDLSMYARSVQSKSSTTRLASLMIYVRLGVLTKSRSRTLRYASSMTQSA